MALSFASLLFFACVASHVISFFNCSFSGRSKSASCLYQLSSYSLFAAYASWFLIRSSSVLMIVSLAASRSRKRFVSKESVLAFYNSQSVSTFFASNSDYRVLSLACRVFFASMALSFSCSMLRTDLYLSVLTTAQSSSFSFLSFSKAVSLALTAFLCSWFSLSVFLSCSYKFLLSALNFCNSRFAKISSFVRSWLSLTKFLLTGSPLFDFCEQLRQVDASD